jgi:hypothetical protein
MAPALPFALGNDVRPETEKDMTSRRETTLPASALLLLTLTAALLLPARAVAQDERRVSFDLFGSYLRQDSAHDQGIGVRGAYRFTDRWAVEGTFNRVTGSEAIAFADLSLKAYVANRARISLYVLGGGGALHVLGDDDATVHLGTGLEIGLGRGAYLRPEVRSRWDAENTKADPILDYSLGFGWQF